MDTSKTTVFIKENSVFGRPGAPKRTHGPPESTKMDEHGAPRRKNAGKTRKKHHPVAQKTHQRAPKSEKCGKGVQKLGGLSATLSSPPPPLTLSPSTCPKGHLLKQPPVH